MLNHAMPQAHGADGTVGMAGVGWGLLWEMQYYVGNSILMILVKHLPVTYSTAQRCR